MRTSVILLFVFVCIFKLSAQESSFSILNNEELQLANGDTIIISGSSNTLELHLSVINVSNSTKGVKLRKFDLDVVDGSNNTFCWGGYCFPPVIQTSLYAAMINDNDTNETFIADYRHHDNWGVSFILYSFFDENNVDDSISVVAKFDASSVGIKENALSEKISVYPNPIVDKVYIESDGVIIKSIDLINSNGIVLESLLACKAIDMSMHKRGIYFLRLETSQGVLTKKIIK